MRVRVRVVLVWFREALVCAGGSYGNIEILFACWRDVFGELSKGLKRLGVIGSHNNKHLVHLSPDSTLGSSIK